MRNLGIVIPYIKNEKVLNIYLKYMKNYMENNYSDIEYHINIIEENNTSIFRKGFLINAGFDLTRSNYDYFNFSDVNILPISVKLKFPDTPLLLSCNNYETNNSGCFFKSPTTNCSMLLRKHDFLKINGVNNDSNEFAYEDINNRLKLVGNELIKHLIKDKNGNTLALCHSIIIDYDTKTSDAVKDDILNVPLYKNGLSTLKYKIINIEKKEYYTKYLIEELC